jgi:hypothetical protein
MTWLLKIDGREKRFVDVGTILDGSLGEVGFYTSEQRLVGFDAVVGGVVEHLNGTVDLGAEEESLCLNDVRGED